MKLKEITFEEWAERIKNYHNLNFFHTCEWFNVLRDSFSHVEIKLYAILDEQSRIIGLLPLEFTRKGPFKLCGSPLPGLFTPYQGPLLLEAHYIGLEGVLRLAVQLFRPHFFMLSLPPDKRKALLVCKGSANWEVKKTFLIDLTLGREQLWKKLAPETRNQVRQAERHGVEIYEPKSLRDWIEDYYAMHVAVYARQGLKPPAKPAFYYALWHHLYEKGQLKVVLAKHEDKVIAGGIFPIYNDTIYFLDGASFREYQKLRANNLIQWYIISWATSEGLSFYDMVGANIPSIAHFKKGFGGVEVEYPYFHMTYGLLGKIGYWFYQKYRPLLKRLKI